MPTYTLADVERAVRESWCDETRPPECQAEWDPSNPSRDQCGVTALVVNDLLGGDLVVGEVHKDGTHVDYHWWNRFGLVDVDLTREQFTAHEVVVGGEALKRPPTSELRRCVDEYLLLRRRVLARLAVADDPPLESDAPPHLGGAVLPADHGL
ncbi:hypothetical protein [Pseudonocardia sp. Ae717_Ps2]|uniref:YunG family protein n=1 Tax=Pseudonocardia sp. Ae717_Ps2 TaxID=1885573 RepID=UPI00094AEC09|nr:hypothetical protein [Pseudonocardia sp. Ae717_Ps2]